MGQVKFVEEKTVERVTAALAADNMSLMHKACSTMKARPKITSKRFKDANGIVAANDRDERVLLNKTLLRAYGRQGHDVH